jgi:hypothetical protein
VFKKTFLKSELRNHSALWLRIKGRAVTSICKIGDKKCLLTNYGKREREEAPEPWDGDKLRNTGNTVRGEAEKWDATNTSGPTP